MSAAYNCANGKANGLPIGNAGLVGLAAAILVFASATYLARTRLTPTHARAPVQAHDTAARAQLIPALWHEPEVAPQTAGTTATLRSVPFAACPKNAAALCARRSKQTRVALRAVPATRFDATSIAAFLRAAPISPKQGKRGHAGAPVALTVATLDADGIAIDAPAAATRAVPGTHVAESKDMPANASLAFATALGQVKTAAQAGVLNGQPAGSLNIGLTRGPVVIDATGMSEVTNLSEPGVFRKTFKLSTRASIPLD
jgi:hypothetical protein